MSLCNDSSNTTMLVEPAGYNCNNGNGNGMWGQDSWWFFIVILALFGGLGGYGGFGGGYGAMNGAGGSIAQGYDTRADLQRGFDNQSVLNKLNGIENGICSLGYDQLNQMNGINQNINSGFAGVNNAVCQLGYNDAQLANGIQMQIANEGRNIDNAICTTGYQTQLGFNTLGSQLASCCCDIREGISGVNYNTALNTNTLQNAIQQNTTQGIMNTNAIQNQISQCCCDNRYDSLLQSNATQTAIKDGFCQTNYNAQSNTRDIIEAANANTRAILDKLVEQEIAAKDAQIAAQNQRLFAAELAASQANQNAYLVNQLKPCPVPAYPACSPYDTPNYVRSGCNSGCGC